MENGISVNVTPFQALLAVAFQVWIIVFPIILIRKINYLTALLESGLEEDSSEDNHNGKI